jgi:hypothetical protein
MDAALGSDAAEHGEAHRLGAGSPLRHFFSGVAQEGHAGTPEVAFPIAGHMPDRLVDNPGESVFGRIEA